ncbi:MAG: 50S ribosomal protein L17 [Deltaproteobacteria bacterium]|nr:50S ribosomal protein L17 [Deltaproteobacteria bacterium]
MRHRVSGRKLSRHTKHRELMFRNMLVSLLQHERIRTTLAKAKELRIWADKIITLAKKNTLHARRQAFARLRNETIVKKLFDEIAPKMKDREGGYTRIYKMGWRQGDGAPLSLVELVTFVHKEEKKKTTVEKAKEVLGKVAPKKKEKKAEEKGKEKTEKKPKKEAKEAPKEKKEKPKKQSKKEE